MPASDPIPPDRQTTAVVRERIAAQIADTFCMVGQQLVLAGSLVLLVDPTTEAGIQGIVFLTFLTLPLYGGLLEGYWGGQTVGKRLLGIKVVDVGGHEPSPGAAMLRNVPAVILFSWLTSLVALASMASTDRRQRVFDTVANTYVVDARRPGAGSGGWETLGATH